MVSTNQQLVLFFFLIFTFFALASAIPNPLDDDLKAASDCLVTQCDMEFARKCDKDFGFDQPEEYYKCICEEPDLQKLLNSCYECYTKFNKASDGDAFINDYDTMCREHGHGGIDIPTSTTKNEARDSMKRSWAGVVAGMVAVGVFV